MKIYFAGKDVCTQTCTHADIDTDTHGLSRIPLWALRQIAFSHVKGQKWNSCCKHTVNVGTLQLLKGGDQYKTLLTSGWKTSRWTDKEFMLGLIKVHTTCWHAPCCIFHTRWSISHIEDILLFTIALKIWLIPTSVINKRISVCSVHSYPNLRCLSRPLGNKSKQGKGKERNA